MNEADSSYYYGNKVSIVREDFEIFYVLLNEEMKRLRQQRGVDQRSYDELKYALDRLRRFRYELRDLPEGSLIQMDKNPHKYLDGYKDKGSFS